MKSACNACGNVAVLYIRKKRMLCEHCCDLQSGATRATSSTSPVLRRGNPMNQPDAITTTALRSACVWCTASCSPRYRWRDKIIAACGWGCAGFWMDREMEREAAEEGLDEGEAYVRRSLGMSP